MKQHDPLFAIQTMSQVLHVSKSGYFNWLKRLPSKRVLQNQCLTEKIVTLHNKSRKTYGYRRIHADLKAEKVPCGIRTYRHLG